MPRYKTSFYADHDETTRYAARTILAPILEATGANSVIDVGCGVGTWLSVARELGAERIRGFEGTWLRPELLVVERDCVTLTDLENPLPDTDGDGLVICLEVAEHLSEARAPTLIAELAAMGDTVLFSAAIPGQGGVHHINERWQSWWADHFDAAGLSALDAVRPSIWNDRKIPYWYRQNCLIYTREPKVRERLAARARAWPLDLVHPELFDRYRQLPGVTASLQLLGGALSRRLKGSW